AAFLSRAYRENDYLLGRLHALDRLIDIVCDTAGLDGKGGQIDILALKKRGFSRILHVEEKHLTHSGELIATPRRRLRESRCSASDGRASAGPAPLNGGPPGRRRRGRGRPHGRPSRRRRVR